MHSVVYVPKGTAADLQVCSSVYINRAALVALTGTRNAPEELTLTIALPNGAELPSQGVS